MSSRTSSRNSGARINGAVGNGAGDMPASRKSSARTEFAQGSNASFSSSLEILEPGDADDVSGRSSSRISLGGRSRSSLGQVPPRNDSSLSQRVTTPTKHVSLTAVRRKQEVETPIEPELDWREFTRSNSRLGLGGRSYSNAGVYLTETAEETTADEAEVPQKMKAQASAKPSSCSKSPADVTTQMEAMALHSTAQSQHRQQHSSSKGDHRDKEEDDDDDGDGGDDGDDGDDDSDSDEEPRKAPNELLMEFLDCIMKKDFKTAEKLCRMILIYEPTNKEAVTFHPIILEKLQLEQEAAEAGEDGSGEEEEEEGDDDDDDDEDSDEDSSLESDSSDDDDDDDEEEEDQAEGGGNFFVIPEEDGPQRPDSGIGM